MANSHSPFISADAQLPEITLKVIMLSILLTIVLASANAYLALKIGMLTSASIPAAVMAMGVLRFFKNANVLETNLVQTAASAGEAVAGGIVYTVPALIIIRYWFGFSYWQNVAIALTGGVIGVMFSIPLRRILVTDKALRFPEGRAIAEVIKARSLGETGLRYLLHGGLTGAILELMQTGLKIFANSWDVWVVKMRSVIGFGAGFSPALIGAGYLIGFEMCFSIFIGAIIAMLSVPIISSMNPQMINGPATVVVSALWGEKIRYLGIGGMLFAGVWTFLTLLKPFYQSIQNTRKVVTEKTSVQTFLRTDFDIPLKLVVLGIMLGMISLYFVFNHFYPSQMLALNPAWRLPIIFSALGYILVMGFVFCAITAYFSGMVGVTASPGSAIIISGILIAALALMAFLHTQTTVLSENQLLAAEAICILIGAVIMGAAAISNDNMQDLKVGYLLGATPWKQQVMLLLGVVISALIIPPIMQLLYSVYGIAGVMPREGMDIAQSLPAPPAALMAALTQAIFHHNVPWTMLSIGMGLLLVVLFVNLLLRKRQINLSVLGVAIGVYLPLASSIPLFIGGIIALLTRRARRAPGPNYHATLIACGLVAGAALMDVVLAIPFSILHSPDALRIMHPDWHWLSVILSLIMTTGLGYWFLKVTKNSNNSV